MENLLPIAEFILSITIDQLLYLIIATPFLILAHHFFISLKIQRSHDKKMKKLDRIDEMRKKFQPDPQKKKMNLD